MKIDTSKLDKNQARGLERIVTRFLVKSYGKKQSGKMLDISDKEMDKCLLPNRVWTPTSKEKEDELFNRVWEHERDGIKFGLLAYKCILPSAYNTIYFEHNVNENIRIYESSTLYENLTKLGRDFGIPASELI